MTFVPDLSLRLFRVWQRDMEVYFSTWATNLVAPLLEPLLYILAFGMGLGSLVGKLPYRGEAVSYVRFLAPALIAAAVMWYAFFETTFASFVRMYYQKTFDAILATPVSLDDLLTGEIVWAATKSVLAATLMLVPLSAFRLLDWPQSLWVPLWAAAGGLLFGCLGLLFTGIVPTIDAFNFPIFLVITPLFLFSGTFFPLELLPGWAQGIALFSPLTHVVGPIRACAFGVQGASALLDLAWLAGMIAVLYPLSLFLMHRRMVE
jgi:lipooligosaccharide transport system permease protein